MSKRERGKEGERKEGRGKEGRGFDKDLSTHFCQDSFEQFIHLLRCL
jgi:hypothetical protein